MALLGIAILQFTDLQGHQPDQIVLETSPDAVTLQQVAPFVRATPPTVSSPFLEEGFLPQAGGDTLEVLDYRIPIFLIWTGQEHADLFENPEFAKQIDLLLFDPTPGIPSLRNYFGQLLQGRVTFPRREDLIKVRLPGSIDDYWALQTSSNQTVTVKHPKRHFFDDLKAWAAGKAMSDGNEGPGISLELSQFDFQKRGNIDLPIFLFVTDSPRVRPMRSWTEWTIASGYSTAAEQPAVFLSSREPGSFRVSSYCAGQILRPLEAGSSPEVANRLRGHGWIAHEILHCFGLPDLYDPMKTTAGCGSACAMGWGGYGLMARSTDPEQARSIPVLPSAWCRKQIFDRMAMSPPIPRVIRPAAGESLLQGTACLNLPSENPGQSSIRIDLGKKGMHDHYLLVELRAEANRLDSTADLFDWDAAFGDGGFLIWEINESVGRTMVNDGRENKFWPLALNGRVKPGAQNSDPIQPLVALRTAGRPPGAAANLITAKAWHKNHCWTKNSPPFEDHGVKIFNFDPQNRSFSYLVQSTSGSSNGPPLIVNSGSPVPTAGPEITLPPEAPAIPGRSATVLDSATSEELEKLEPEVGERFSGLVAYKGKPIDLRIGSRMASLDIPANFSRIRQQFESQMELIELNKVKESENSGMFAKIDKLSLNEIKSEWGTEARDNLYTLLDGREMRVAGTQMLVKRDEENRDWMRYEFTVAPAFEEKIKALREELKNSGKRMIDEREFRALVEKKMSGYLKNLKAGDVIPEWELVADPERSRVVWQCKVPNLHGTPPWIIESDAVIDTDGSSNNLNLRIK